MYRRKENSGRGRRGRTVTEVGMDCSHGSSKTHTGMTGAKTDKRLTKRGEGGKRRLGRQHKQRAAKTGTEKGHVRRCRQLKLEKRASGAVKLCVWVLASGLCSGDRLRGAPGLEPVESWHPKTQAKHPQMPPGTKLYFTTNTVGIITWRNV
jgi:hypothetical protein